jgi:NADH-quinone oxidoreductase subunit G
MMGRGDEEHVSTFHDLTLDRTKCIQCGQCSAICPTGAMREQHDIFEVLDVLERKDKVCFQSQSYVSEGLTPVCCDRCQVKVVSIAPSVRVAMSEEFGLEPGAVTAEQIFEGLKLLGFDAIFDTNYSADLTVRLAGRAQWDCECLQA